MEEFLDVLWGLLALLFWTVVSLFLMAGCVHLLK